MISTHSESERKIRRERIDPVLTVQGPETGSQQLEGCIEEDKKNQEAFEQNVYPTEVANLLFAHGYCSACFAQVNREESG